MLDNEPNDANYVWLHLIDEILNKGQEASPRMLRIR